jgi:hypothetical protein
LLTNTENEPIKLIGVIEKLEPLPSYSRTGYAFLTWFNSIDEIAQFIAGNSLPCIVGPFLVKELWDAEMQMKSEYAINYTIDSGKINQAEMVSENTTIFKIFFTENSANIKYD